jgi:glycosyltransferase involved in cell wall biosynthesis
VRILYLSPYAPERCGIGDYTAGFVRTARGLGNEVGVVTASELEGAPDEVIAALPRSREELDQAVETIAAWDPDVVHLEFAVSAYGLRIPLLFDLLRRLGPFRFEVAVTMHEVTRDTQSLRLVGRALYRRLAALCDRVVVHTDSALDALGPVHTPVAVVPHPRAELPPATATTDELRARHYLGDARVLLAFGFIHVDKGLDDLVEALHILGRDDVRLVVAGDVRERRGIFRLFELRDRLHLRHVKRVIGVHGLDRRVVFTGYVPGGEIRPWFELADAAVLPYTRIEQSGVANLAGAAGAPTLVSRVGGLVQEGSDPRWTFPARDPRALAATLRDFLESGGDATGEAAPELPVVVQRTLRFYEEERDVQYA